MPENCKLQKCSFISNTKDCIVEYITLRVKVMLLMIVFTMVYKNEYKASSDKQVKAKGKAFFLNDHITKNNRNGISTTTNQQLLLCLI